MRLLDKMKRKLRYCVRDMEVFNEKKGKSIGFIKYNER